jgi:DNA-binding LacI/PurR family transcriptional regulator
MNTMLRYKEIKNMLTVEIVKMSTNDRLPSRPELCKRLDTTRTTLDKAINELVTEGLLYSRKGGGTYVAGAGDKLPIHVGQSWGVIVPDVREALYAEIVRGAENVAQSYGINIILCNSDSDFEKQEQYIKRLNHFGVSGLIILLVPNRIEENFCLYRQLTELKVPFVFCNRNAEGFPALVVASSDYYGAYIATKHLLDRGYCHIAYISHRKDRASFDRSEGYILALMENKIEVDREIIAIKEHPQPQLFGYETMKKFLISGQSVDAVFCFNDSIAQGAYQAITELGLTASDDIGVIGYDNTDICEKLTPAVTSVSWKGLEAGAKAAEMLYKKISGAALSDFELYLFKPELVVRDSCLGPKKADERNETGRSC